MFDEIKNPRLLVAEILEAYPQYTGVPSVRDATRLQKQADRIKQDIRKLRPYLLSEEELKAKLENILESTRWNGVWELRNDPNYYVWLEAVIEKNKKYGFDYVAAQNEAERLLKRDGLASSIKEEKIAADNAFVELMRKYQSDLRFTKSDVPVIDAVNIRKSDMQRLANEFVSGNFLYHGTITKQLLEILHSGYISNAGSLYEAEEKSAKREQRESELIHRNSGFEGVSWSWNEIDALPGDRYHLAGFLAAPESILGTHNQFYIPSRPAVGEVVQIPKSINAEKFYEAKTQADLYYHISGLSEVNSVLSNFLQVAQWLDPKVSNDVLSEPMLMSVGRKLALKKDYQTKLREYYETGQNGSIKFSTRLLGQIDDDIPVACVWIQAAIDTNRLLGTAFTQMDLLQIIDSLSLKNLNGLIKKAKADWSAWESILGKAPLSEIKVSTNQMYLVAARKDVDYWLRAIASSAHKPKGIILYNDKKIRLENFASDHRGDNVALTKSLRGIIPINDSTIPFSDILGYPFDDSMRAGHHHQLIAEYFLSRRRSVTLQDGKLVMKGTLARGNVRLTIYRGAHVPDAMPSLAKQLWYMNRVFLESPSVKNDKRIAEHIYNSVTHQEPGDSPIPENWMAYLKADLWGQLALKLQGRHITFRLVDTEYKDENDLRNDVDSMFEFNVVINAIERIIFYQWDERYQILDDAITESAGIIGKRDKLVAKQVIEEITGTLHDHIDTMVKKRGSYNMALVQGYAHHTLKLLRDRLPDFEVTEKIFSPSVLNNYLSANYFTELLEKKNENPLKRLPHKELDYLLYWVLAQKNKSIKNKIQKKINKNRKPTDNLIEAYKSQMNGLKDSNYQELVAATRNLRPIHKFSANSLLSELTRLRKREVRRQKIYQSLRHPVLKTKASKFWH